MIILRKLKVILRRYIMANIVPKRIATAILNSLKSGVVPRVGLEYIAVGRKQEIETFLHDIGIIEDGGAAFRFVVGKYGSGKSFLMQTVRNYAMERGLVVVDADLSPERRLVGTKGQGLATYKELIKNMSTKTKPDGGALSLILEKWISGIKVEVLKENQVENDSPQFIRLVEAKIFTIINDIEEMVHGFDFAKAINLYWQAYRSCDDEKKDNVLKWFRGEYNTKTEAKRDIGVNVIIGDDNWYEYLKLFSCFMVRAGYKAMLVLIDEIVNIYTISHSVTRQSNYEKILTMFNDTMQGKAKYIGIIMGGTPQSIDDTRRGVFSYEALKSRLEEGRFDSEELRDMFAPIIRLKTLTNEEMFVLIEKLTDIHANLYGYKSPISVNELISFLKVEYERIGADANITPREVIRDFIGVLNILFQNPTMTIGEIIGNETFEFAKDTITDEKIHEEFAEFVL
jgi:Protein of unknown function (DUF2791).